MNILEAIQKEDGFVSEKIEIRNGPYGSSIFSKMEIQKDETIMEINSKSIISVDSILKSDALRNFIGAMKMDLNPYDLLAIYLTLSKITGENAAYISSLQVTFDSPLTWPASDVLELPLEIKFFVMSTLSHVKKVFSALNEQLPELIEFKLFKWCYLNVITRNFNGGVLASTTPAWLEINSRNQNASLIPGLDMCNHWNPANCQYRLKDDRFLLTAKDKIDPNSEIFISYGNKKGDQELLSTYGFVLPLGVNSKTKVQLTPLDLQKATMSPVSQFVKPGADNLVKFYLTIDSFSPELVSVIEKMAITDRDTEMADIAVKILQHRRNILHESKKRVTRCGHQQLIENMLFIIDNHLKDLEERKVLRHILADEQFLHVSCPK